MQASQACPPPEAAPESRLKTPWNVHGLRENYFSAWNGLVKHRDENFYHDSDCFIVFGHNFTVPLIQWFLLTHEKGMKRGSISVTFSHGGSIRYQNCADEKREKILTSKLKIYLFIFLMWYITQAQHNTSHSTVWRACKGWISNLETEGERDIFKSPLFTPSKPHRNQHREQYQGPCKLTSWYMSVF